MDCSLAHSGSSRVNPDVGGFEGEPDLSPLLQAHLREGGGRDLRHQGDIAVDANSSSTTHELDAAHTAWPDVARAAFRVPLVNGDSAWMDYRENFTRLGGGSCDHRS